MKTVKKYEQPYLEVISFGIDDIITVSTPMTTEKGGVEVGTGNGEITIPFSDFFS